MRSGIQAIDDGQFEATKSLGFTRRETMRHIILPQAIRNAIPRHWVMN
ncbi:ABC transporter permease subunit [Erysipelothrix sp. D19-032]